MTVTTEAPAARGWASVDDRPEMFLGEKHAWKRARLAAGLKQATVVRRMSELAALQGVSIATPASLKTMLSCWENGKRTVTPLYEELLCRIYGIRRAQDVIRRPGRYRNNAIYDRFLKAPAFTAPVTVPGLR